MRIAIASSLQGYPEESSPGDPMDTRRLGRYVAEHLQALFPQIEIGLYDRDDVGGIADSYLALRDQLMAWGADISIHIHQDASSDPTARGWCILYYHAKALSLANEIESAMRSIPSPFRGVLKRKIAATTQPEISVLIEAGFYPSVKDELIGIVGWGDPIVAGAMNYLARHYGIYPQHQPTEEDEDMAARVTSPVAGEHHFPDVWLEHFKTYYLHMQNRGKEEAHVIVSGCQRKEDGGSYFTIKEMDLAPDGQANTYDAFDLKAAALAKGSYKSINVSVHSTQPITCVLREE
jgi:hypothetical protein